MCRHNLERFRRGLTAVIHGRKGCINNIQAQHHAIASPIVYQERLFPACFPVFSTVSLELAIKAVPISDCLSVLKPDLKLFIQSGFY